MEPFGHRAGPPSTARRPASHAGAAGRVEGNEELPPEPARAKSRSHVLIHEDWAPAGVHGEAVGRPCRPLVRLLLERRFLRLQLSLQPANVDEGVEPAGVAVPTVVEREGVALEHPLELPDYMVAILWDRET